MTAVALPQVVDQAGAYPDMPTVVYHADPIPGGSLSYSGAKRLLPPSTPAKFRWWVDNGQPVKKEFDFGHAAHAEMLGIGEPIIVVDAADWKTKAAREAATEARAAGAVPILPKDRAVIDAMGAKLREHPLASALLDPLAGRPELSLFWPDNDFGVWRRSRLDWYRPPSAGRRAIIVDYKTCDKADPDAVAKAIADYRYHQQGAYYLDGATACGLDGDIPTGYVMVFQEKTAPYELNVVEPDWYALGVGAALNRRALDVFARCQASGVWPGYMPDPTQATVVSLPGWVERQHERALWAGDYDTEADTP